jgi:hypothetical protein
MVAASPPLHHGTAVVTQQGMTRTQQTWLIVSAIAVAAIFLAWVLWPEPNLDGMHPVDKCHYSSYYKNHGGSYQACYDLEMDNTLRRLNGGF